MWTDYAVPGGTFRENLLGHRHLADDHYGAKFKYSRDTNALSNFCSEEIKENSKADLKAKLHEKTGIYRSMCVAGHSKGNDQAKPPVGVQASSLSNGQWTNTTASQ